MIGIKQNILTLWTKLTVEGWKTGYLVVAELGATEDSRFTPALLYTFPPPDNTINLIKPKLGGHQ